MAVEVKRIYGILAVIGAIVPNLFLGFVYLNQGGFDFTLFIQGAFANPGAQFFAIDLLLTVGVFWIFVYKEVKKHRIHYWWIAIIGNFLIGLCFALPMFLYLRERTLQQKPRE